MPRYSSHVAATTPARYLCSSGCGYVLAEPGDCPICGPAKPAPPPVESSASAQVRRKVWSTIALSVLLYLLASLLPIARESAHGGIVAPGYLGLLFGWMGMLSVFQGQLDLGAIG